MSSEVVEYDLKSVCLLVADCPHTTPKWTESGAIVLRNQNIKNGRLDLNSPSFTDEEHYLGRVKRAKPQHNDIVITREAPMGDVCQIPKDLKCCLGQRQVLLRPNPEKIESRYLLYALQAPYIQNQISWNEGTGSTVSNLRIPVLEALKIPTPPIASQIEISTTLGSLDDRITLLRETNATLEAIAQALFKSWFVDFDPVRAKMEGRAPEGMDEETAALFPDSFEESELGLVPRGWKIQALSEVCKISSGKRPHKRSDIETQATKIPLFGGAGFMGFTSESLFDAPKIVTGRVGTLGKNFIVYPPFWASDNALILSPLKEQYFHFCFNWLNEIDVHRLNRGAVQPLLTQKDLGRQQRIMPPDCLIEIFSGLIKSIYKKINHQTHQAQTLASLRDTLLPRLISGQLRVGEV